MPKPKLTGRAYRDYWKQRAAKQGPNYVGQIRELRDPDKVAAQADRFWQALCAVLPMKGIHDVTEFGCGWGRMAVKLHERYPDGNVRGIEMVAQTIRYGRSLFAPEEVQFYQGDHYTEEVPPCDLLVTCTVLQHITDPRTWTNVVASFHARVKPGGWLVMLENDHHGVKSPHMTERTIEDYRAAFPGFAFRYVVPYPRRTLDREAHVVMAAQRK